MSASLSGVSLGEGGRLGRLGWRGGWELAGGCGWRLSEPSRTCEAGFLVTKNLKSFSGYCSAILALSSKNLGQFLSVAICPGRSQFAQWVS